MSKKIIIIVFIMIGALLFILWQNNDIVTSKIDYSNSKLPKEFNGYKIVHISDLHNKRFGKGQKRLLKKVKAACPDIIVVTGDLIDRRRYDLETALIFINGAMKIAPVYYVPGNHEAWSGQYDNIKYELSSLGVEVLDDVKMELTEGKGKIEILGLSDPAFLTDSYSKGTNLSKLEENLINMSDYSIFQILLCHRPELFHLYVNANIEITFSGHAHGGQFRLPFIGGLIAPCQGFFPKYTSGVHEEKQSTLVISRGLGNSIIPIRIFNRPEIIVLTLENQDIDKK